MQIFDLGIAYKWIYDKELTDLIEQMFQSDGLTTFVIGEHNVHDITGLLIDNKLKFRAYLDRASDEDVSFDDAAKKIVEAGTYIINNYTKVEVAADKATMHHKLELLNFNIPDTFICPPFEKNPELVIPKTIQQKISKPFVIKPSYYSGGGDGVVTHAYDFEQIQTERRKLPDDQFLVQEKIYPIDSDKRRIWFRCFWFFDEAIPVWWDDITHLYDEVDRIDFEKYNLQRLVDVTKKLADITGLDYFSTEGTIDKNGELVLIDYVNDQCDMRMKSKHYDGVPNDIVVKFVENMIRKVKSIKK